MSWDIEATSEFLTWFGDLSEEEQDAVDYSISLLASEGAKLGRPYADTVRSKRFPNLKELRSQAGGQPLRSFFAFDPRRTAILLIGGNKTGDDRFYERMIPYAEELYATYLDEIKREGLI
jgi:hypothetical protein